MRRYGSLININPPLADTAKGRCKVEKKYPTCFLIQEVETRLVVITISHFSKSRKTEPLQVRIVITTGRTVGLAEWIIGGTHVFFLLLLSFFTNLRKLKRKRKWADKFCCMTIGSKCSRLYSHKLLGPFLGSKIILGIPRYNLVSLSTSPFNSVLKPNKTELYRVITWYNSVQLRFSLF